jgi:hypothetical protein
VILLEVLYLDLDGVIGLTNDTRYQATSFEDAQGPSSCRTRLVELAAQAGVFMDKSPAIPTTQTVPFFTERDRVAAEALVRQKRHEAFSSKSHIFRRSPSQRNFKRDEVYSAIESVIREGGPPSVLRCLLDQSRDAKVKKKTLFTKDKSTSPDINRLLQLATEKGDSAMVLLLAEDAEPIGLDSALKHAVASSSLDCVAALLQNGANPNVCSWEFIAAVDSGDRLLVSIFLAAKFPLEGETLVRALSIAVRGGSIQLVILLLQYGANGDDKEIVETAVQNARIDITAALVLAHQRPSPACLDSVIPIAHRLDISESKKLTMIELLLCAGARGPRLGSALVAAVEEDDKPLVSLIVDYNGHITNNPCEAIISALSKGNLDFFKILCRSGLGADDASDILGEFPKKGTRLSVPDRFYVVSSLMNWGAYGAAVDKYLVYAADKEDINTVELLINGGASVDYDKAKALLKAMLSGAMPIFKAILVGKPGQESLNYCLQSLPRVSTNLQLSVLTAVLVTGARGAEVDKLLVNAIAGDFSSERESFIDVLVRNGADVNTANGICLQKAVGAGDTVALNLLLKGQPSPASLSTAIPFARSLPAADLRFAMLDLLLSSGAQGPIVDHHFLDLTDQHPPDLNLIKLFLEKANADVNLNNGRPLQLACKYSNGVLLALFLQHNPSTSTLNAALPFAVSLPDQQSQHTLCQQLLAAGAQGEALDNALVDVQRSSRSHPQLLELLLAHGANVSFRNGTVIRKAIKNQDVQQLALLASKKPTLQVLTSALQLLVTVNTQKRDALAKILLDAGGAAMREPIDRVLPIAVGLDETDMPFLELLLEYGASVDYDRGLAVRNAIDTRNFEVLHLLLQRQVSAATLERAFASAWALDKADRLRYVTRVLASGYAGSLVDDALVEEVQDTPRDDSTIDLLCRHGASVHHQMHLPLVHAATSLDYDLLEKFLGFVTERSGVSYAFGEVITSPSANWLSDAGFSVLELLLENGASGDVVSIALVLSVEHSNNAPVHANFVELLLRYQASVDYQDGRALQSAIRMKQLTLVKKILSRQPSGETMTRAFASMLGCDFSEDDIIQLIEIFKNSPTGMPDLDNLRTSDDNKLEEPLTFTCMRRWPRGPRILEQVLLAGVNVDKTIPYVIEPEEGLEHVSPLLWALLQPQQRISPYVIECLLNHGGELTLRDGLMKPSALTFSAFS